MVNATLLTPLANLSVEMFTMYRKSPKNSDIRKIRTVSFYYGIMGPKDADGLANSVDPDQTAPLGAI